MTDESNAPALAQFEELRKFVRLDAEDLHLLRVLASHASPHLSDIARGFYERTREHEDAHAVFRDEAQVERLHGSMVRWLERILTGPYDASYIEQSARIGRRHVQVGLPMRFVFATMALFRSELTQIAFEHMPRTQQRVCAALNCIMDLELALMCQTYSEAKSQHHERLRRKASEPNEASLLDNAIELMDTVLIALDEDHRILLFNEEASRLTGYARGEVLGESFDDLFVPPGRGLSESLAQVSDIKLGEYRSFTPSVLLKTRTGTLRSLAGRLCRPKTRNGAFCFVIGRDVTERLVMEARLRRSEKLAAIGTLAAGLAHEIRNPLNGAQLHVRFIQRGLQKLPDTHELSAAATVVNGEIRRLSDLVSDFLDFARPHALQLTQVALQPLCERCVNLLKSEAEAVGAKLTCSLPSTPVVAEVDEARVEQVLLNLLRNAIEAIAETAEGKPRSPHDPGCVDLKLTRRPRDALLLITDNGPGLVTQAPVWDAFFSTKENGTGLGLAIAHRIVTDHGGTVSFESESGKTVFRVELPLFNPEAARASWQPST